MSTIPARSLLPAADPPAPTSVDSDIVVILAALLCALICVVGLALVARCAWFRRSLSSPTPAPTKGLKRKVLRSLPKLSFHQAFSSSDAKISAECPICLAEFVEGDEIRILPQCGHAFHVGCVDTWLGSRSSCPSCRRVLVASEAVEAKCHTCGASSGEVEAAAKAREDRDASRFLP